MGGHELKYYFIIKGINKDLDPPIDLNQIKNDPLIFICMIMICLIFSGCKSPYRTDREASRAGEMVPSNEVMGGEIMGGETNTGGERGGREGNGGGEEISGGEQAPPSAGEPVTGTQVESVKPALKIKDYRQLEADLSANLALTTEELCNELDEFSCLQTVHTLTLGGVSPDKQSIYIPNELSSISAPIALDRVVYSACGARVRKDFSNPSTAVLFGSLNLDGNRLADPNSSETRSVIEELFKRAFLRVPNATEVEGLLALYEEIAADPNEQQPASSWAWATCYAIFTSVEFVFY